VDTQSFLYLAIFVAIAFLELVTLRFGIGKASAHDGWLDLTYFLQSMVVVGPIISLGLSALETHWLPEYAGRYAWVPLAWQFVGFIIADDFIQYWFHRAVHTYPILWPLHRAHHSASYMGVRIAFRNGFFYMLLFPNVWLSGLLVYLGFGRAFVAYSIVKAAITLSAHSTLRWDAVLYRHAALRPLAWLLERTISTPATHFAHHAANDHDGLGNPNGNYGNLLFFWDILFGTALITRKYPDTYGLPNASERDLPWYVMLFYPLVRKAPAKRPEPSGSGL
jgi:sterol desaturase/sphingolipid hydroxylase (fatty acid hydroxylase superfamily)